MSISNNVISGVFAFAKVTEPVYKYESDLEKEFTIDIAVDEETYDEFVEQFPKQKGKIVKTSEFESIYKFPPVFPDEKKQFVLKLKKPANFKKNDWELIDKQWFPKIIVKKDGKVTPLKDGVLIGNGSKGKVHFEENTNGYGTFARLKSVLVESLIEYNREGGDAASVFGLTTSVEGESDFASDGNGGNVKVPTSAKTKETPKVKPKAAPKPQDDFEEDGLDLPF